MTNSPSPKARDHLGDAPSRAEQSDAVREAEERLERLRAFIQDSLDLGHDRATIGNLMSARDEVDAATPLVAALRVRASELEKRVGVLTERLDWALNAAELLRDMLPLTASLKGVDASIAKCKAALAPQPEALADQTRHLTPDEQRLLDAAHMRSDKLVGPPEAPADQDGETGR